MVNLYCFSVLFVCVFFCCNLDDYEKRAASPKYFWLTFCVYVKRELAAVSLGLDLAFFV